MNLLHMYCIHVYEWSRVHEIHTHNLVIMTTQEVWESSPFPKTRWTPSQTSIRSKQAPFPTSNLSDTGVCQLRLYYMHTYTSNDKGIWEVSILNRLPSQSPFFSDLVILFSFVQAEAIHVYIDLNDTGSWGSSSVSKPRRKPPHVASALNRHPL